MMDKYWKVAVAAIVIVIAAFVVIPKFSQPAIDTTGSNDGSSLSVIQDALRNGKPTLLLLRSST